MKDKKTARCLAAMLAAVMIFCTGCGRGEGSDSTLSETAAEEKAAPVYDLTEERITKDETVYTNLAPDGTVTDVNVTDHLHSAMPEVRVRDITNLTQVRDTRTDLSPVLENGEMFWDMSSTDLYYSGNSEQAPPINVKITYTMDGEEMTASQIQGKSGEVAIDVAVENHIEKVYNGVSYRCPLMLMGGMILPIANFDNIKVTNGLILGDGERQVVFFMGVPGIDESLGLSSLGGELKDLVPDYSHFTVTAKAEDFSLGNIMMAAVPFSSIRALGGEEMYESLEGIKGVMTDIDAVMASVAGLGVQDLIQMIYGDATQAQSLLNAVSDAQSLYRENQALLTALSDFATEENMQKLENLLSDLQGMDTSAIQPLVDSQIYQQWLNWLSSLGGSIGSAADLLRDLQEVKPVLDKLNAQLSRPEVAQAMENLPETKQRLQNLVDAMNSSQELFDRMQELTGDNARGQIGNITSILEKYSLMDGLSEQQTQNLAERVKNWMDFGKEYTIFTQHTDQQDASVIFVFKVDSAAG